MKIARLYTINCSHRR